MMRFRPHLDVYSGHLLYICGIAPKDMANLDWRAFKKASNYRIKFIETFDSSAWYVKNSNKYSGVVIECNDDGGINEITHAIRTNKFPIDGVRFYTLQDCSGRESFFDRIKDDMGVDLFENKGVPNSKRDVRVIRKNIARLYAKDGRKFTPEKTKKYGDRSRRRAKFTSENMKEPKDDANDSLTSSSSPMSSNST